ncbi:hypothetical protein RFI_00614, partial [Reticulomyxa filosa]
FLPWVRLINIRALLFQYESLKFLAGSNELNFETVGLFVNVELVILLGLFCPLIVPLCAMATVSNILNFQYLLNKKTQSAIPLKESLIENNNTYKLSDEIPAFPISILLVSFLLQQLIWIFSGTLSDNHSHLIKNAFGIGFSIVDVCFILAIISRRFHVMQILKQQNIFSSLYNKCSRKRTFKSELITSNAENEDSMLYEPEYHYMQPMETLKEEL